MATFLSLYLSLGVFSSEVRAGIFFFQRCSQSFIGLHKSKVAQGLRWSLREGGVGYKNQKHEKNFVLGMKRIEKQ